MPAGSTATRFCAVSRAPGRRIRSGSCWSGSSSRRTSVSSFSIRNSDYVRLGEPRADANAELAAGYADAARGVVVRSAGNGSSSGIGQLDPSARAAALQLDPVAEREEFALVDELLGAGRAFEELATSDSRHARALRLRAENLGVPRWQLWARGRPGTLVDDVERRDARCLVVDLGSLSTREEQTVAAEAVLATLWLCVLIASPYSS